MLYFFYIRQIIYLKSYRIYDVLWETMILVFETSTDMVSKIIINIEKYNIRIYLFQVCLIFFAQYFNLFVIYVVRRLQSLDNARF